MMAQEIARLGPENRVIRLRGGGMGVGWGKGGEDGMVGGRWLRGVWKDSSHWFRWQSKRN